MIKTAFARFGPSDSPTRLDAIAPSEFGSIFEPLSYEPWKPEVDQVEGQFTVTRSAAVFPSLKLSRKLQYRNPLSRLQMAVIAAASLVRRKSKSLDGAAARKVGIIHSSWTAGYYHWLTEGLPRALALRETYPDAVPTLPSQRYAPYFESLEALGFTELALFPSGSNLTVRDPVLTSCPKRFATTDPEILRKLRAEIFARFGVVPAKPFRKVYISRKKSRGRIVANERDVEAALRQTGFEIIYAEKLSFEEQVRLFAETSILVSIHGAGLTNALFMQPGTSMIELLPRRNGIFDYHRGRNSFRHDACYVRLAAAMGLTYAFVLCKTDVPFYKGTHMANIEVDISSLLDCLSLADID